MKCGLRIILNMALAATATDWSLRVRTRDETQFAVLRAKLRGLLLKSHFCSVLVSFSLHILLSLDFTIIFHTFTFTLNSSRTRLCKSTQIYIFYTHKELPTFWGLRCVNRQVTQHMRSTVRREGIRPYMALGTGMKPLLTWWGGVRERLVKEWVMLAIWV